MVFNGQLVREVPRMGCLLYARYGDRIGSIIMHHDYHSPRIASLLERALAGGGRESVGFDLANSPLEGLRDTEPSYYQYQPLACFSDVAQGYILLRPASSLTPCLWMKDYVSAEMFGRHRPFYGFICEQSVHSPAQVNQIAERKKLRF